MAKAKLKQSWSVRKKARPAEVEFDDEDGVFALFFDRQPELAARETRTIYLLDQQDGIPPGEYAFAEAFCQGRTCDCRRVMFMVYRREIGDNTGRPEHIVTFGYGWEPLEFYVTWMHGDREGAEIMSEPGIELNSPLCEYGHQLLDLFVKSCLSAPDYVARVRRHYEIFQGRRAGAELRPRA